MTNENATKTTWTTRIASLFLVPAMILCFSGTAEAASGNSGPTKIEQTYTTYNGTYAVRLASGTGPCANSAYWGFNATTNGGKVLMAKLEAAYLARKTVHVHCNGKFGSLNNITAVYAN